MAEEKKVQEIPYEEEDKKTPQYDAGYKRQFSNTKEFLHFLRKYVKAEWAKEVTKEDISLCDKEFILEDYQKRVADMVYKIRWRDQVIYIYLVMELQSTVDYTMPFRLLAYMFSLMLKIFLAEDKNVREQKGYRLPAVIPILFYNGDDPWNVPVEFGDYQRECADFGGHMLNFTYYLVNLKEISNEYILSTNTLIDNILALDKNRKNKKGLGRILEAIEERIGELKEEEKVSFIEWLEYVMMAVVDEEGKKQVRVLMDEMKGDAGSMIHGLQLLMLDQKEAGRTEGRSEGIGIGEDQFAELTKRLIADSRTEDLLKAASDKAFRERLYKEYEIKDEIKEEA